jgi:diguanylate cyclase (GGDEF)-like protein
MPWGRGNDRRAAVERRLPASLEPRAALEDRLTGLPARATIEAELVRAVEEAKESGEIIGVGCVDLNRFVKINEQFGALVGDQCLREVARRLRECVREEDVIGRTAADDFMIVFRGLSGRSQAVALATRIRTRLGELFKTGNLDITMAAACGVAVRPTDGATAQQLVQFATFAMQQQKGGRPADAPPDVAVQESAAGEGEVQPDA